MSTPRDALTYAEDTLGVHRVYDECEAARNRLDETLTLLAVAKDNVRDIEFRLADRELEVAADERGRHPEMSAAGMEKHLKVALNNDDDVRELREQLGKSKSDVEGLEFDRHMADTDIRIDVARMIELGGYFQYLSVVKDVANRRPDAGTVVGVQYG